MKWIEEMCEEDMGLLDVTLMCLSTPATGGGGVHLASPHSLLKALANLPAHTNHWQHVAGSSAVSASLSMETLMTDWTWRMGLCGPACVCVCVCLRVGRLSIFFFYYFYFFFWEAFWLAMVWQKSGQVLWSALIKDRGRGLSDLTRTHTAREEIH